jgi:hypothetical protein
MSLTTRHALPAELVPRGATRSPPQRDRMQAQAIAAPPKGIAMFVNPQSHDAAEIIRGLSMLPGGISVQVTAKKFPRRGPAETLTHYRQEEQSFDPHHLPEDLPIPNWMDEIAITMEGALDEEQSTLDLLTRVDVVLGAAHTNMNWDARTFLGNPQSHPRPYKINVFCDLFRA